MLRVVCRSPHRAVAQLERAVQNANKPNVQSDLTFTMSANAQIASAIGKFLGTLDKLVSISYVFANLTGTNSITSFPVLSNDACAAFACQ